MHQKSRVNAISFNYIFGHQFYCAIINIHMHNIEIFCIYNMQMHIFIFELIDAQNQGRHLGGARARIAPLPKQSHAPPKKCPLIPTNKNQVIIILIYIGFHLFIA